MLIPLYIVAITSSDTLGNQMGMAAVSNLRARVYGTLSLIDGYRTMVDGGMMTEDEALGRIGDIICGPEIDGERDITGGFLTGREGYVDIFDEDGTYVVHPFYEGRTIKESNLERYETITREKRGLISYSWQNPGEPEPREKVEAFGLFEPWGLFVVSTAYVDECMEPMVTMRNYMASTIALVAFASFFSIFLSNELRKVKGNTIIVENLTD